MQLPLLRAVVSMSQAAVLITLVKRLTAMSHTDEEAAWRMSDKPPHLAPKFDLKLP